MAAHVGSIGNDNISVIDKTPLPGYKITATTGSVTPSGDFTDPSLTVNALAGNDNINLSTLTKESGITSTTLDGGDGNDLLVGSNGLGLTPGSPLSIPLTSPDGKINLTSLGKGTIGSTVYTIWKLHNGTNAVVGATLTPYGSSSPVFTGNLPPNTDTIVLSLISTGAATHILNTTSGSFTKAADSKDNNYLAFGNDSLLGGNGDDTLSGLGGNDTIDGGAGTDTVLESGNVNFTLTNNSLTGNGNDALISIEQARLTGGSGDNNLDASAFTLGGSVTLDGAGGNDTLIGGSGNDFLTGGTGNNSLDGGAGTDTVVESGNVNFTLTNTLLTGTGIDSLINIEQARLTGGSGNNTINASTFNLGSVTLDGGAGNDTLLGGLGNDFLTGGSGNDSLNGGAGTDTVVEFANFNFTLTNSSLTGNGTDSLTSIEQARLTGGISNNTITASLFSGSVTLDGGAGNDTLTGGTNSDSLLGGLDNDSLLGGNGNDTLAGGLGKDTLTGGANADTFTYTTLTDSLLANFDIITDYSASASDRLDAPATVTPVTLTGSVGTATGLTQSAIQAILTTTTFLANTAVAFKVTGQTTSTYIAFNDGTAGFNQTTDSIIQLQNFATISAGNSVVII